MKKLMLVVVCFMTLGLTSCGKDDVIEAAGLTCVSLATKYAEAQNKYSTDPSTDNCAALKYAILAYQVEGCEGSGDIDADTACQ